jgi:ferritin-like metal-binding protein YciE
MATKNPKDIFVRLLSDIRQGTERISKVFQEISQAAQNPEIKQ